MRVFERLDELYAIGGGPGANRPHPSAAEDEAHRLAARWLEEAGLEVEVDRHGNLFGHAQRSGAVDTVSDTCGSARTSTASPRAVASTGRSASWRQSRLSSESDLAPSWSFAGRKSDASEAARALRPAGSFRGRFSSSMSSRDPFWPNETCRSES